MTRALLYCGEDLGTVDAGASGSADLPFGAQELARHGVSLATPAHRPVPRKVFDLVNHRTGVQIDRPGWQLARQADLVIAYLEPNIGYPAAMRRLPGSPFGTPLLAGLFCWAAEDLRSGSARTRRRALSLLGACDIIGYWSSNQTQIYLDHGVPRHKLVPLRFGIRTSHFANHGPAERDIDALAVGQDHGRDYATLAAAVAGTGMRVTVVAPRSRLAGIALPPEVDVRGRVDFEAYRGLLRRARTVVVPTRDLAYPTGQTVALEAAASGCAVVVTDTPAMRDYFTPDVDALMPRPGDALALRECLRLLRADPAVLTRLADAGAESVHQRFDERVMWGQLMQHVRSRR